MPQRKSAQKQLESDKKKRQKNLVLKRNIKQAIKTYLKALNSSKAEETQKALATVYKQLDKASAKRYIHKNKASRKKSRLAKRMSSLKKKK